MPKPPVPRRDAWLADLAILVALVPLGTCMGVVGALLTLGALAGWVERAPLAVLGLALLVLGTACLTAALSSVRRTTPEAGRPRRGLRLTLFGVVVVVSWALFLRALLAVR